MTTPADSLPVWGTEDNGRLAVSILTSGLTGLQDAAPSPEQEALLRNIVFAPDGDSAAGDIGTLFDAVPKEVDQLALAALRALAEDLADNFIFAVELPDEVVGRRTLVKLTYDDALGGAPAHAFRSGYATTVKGGAWSGAASWHLEVHAPDGLAVADLSYESWDLDSLELIDFDETPVTGHTAHIRGSRLPSTARTDARLVIRPDRIGLVNQTLVAAVFAWALVTLGCLTAPWLALRVLDAGRAGSIAAVTLAIPAFIVALMARSQEHELTSRVLLGPRLLNAATALVLLAGAATLVLGLSESTLAWTLRALWVLQALLVGWSYAIWRSVGAGT